MKAMLKVFVAGTVLGCCGGWLAARAAAEEPGAVRLSRESFLVALGKGCQRQEKADFKQPTLYLVVHGFWKIDRWRPDLGESHSIEFSVTEPNANVQNYHPKTRWNEEIKCQVPHHDAILPVAVEGYEVVLRKILDNSNPGAGKAADEQGLYAVLFDQKYAANDCQGVRCWVLTVASSSAEGAKREAIRQLTEAESDRATIDSVVALDSVQGYAVSLRPEQAKGAKPANKKPDRTSCSLLLGRSRQPATMSSPKLYAAVFGTRMNGEDQGVIFLAAEKNENAHNKEQEQWNRKVPGFHFHQLKEIAEIEGYAVTLETKTPVAARSLYAVVVTQKLEGRWGGVDRWVELVAAANEEEAQRQASNASRVATSGKTSAEFCCRLDSVDGYAVTLHEKQNAK
jgi:hypothetical protein